MVRSLFELVGDLVEPALAQASSLSPPGEPETPTAPMTSSPTLIGNPPALALMPVSQSAAPGGLSFCRCANSPEEVRKVRAVKALRWLFSSVCGEASSPRKCAMISPLRPTTATVTR